MLRGRGGRGEKLLGHQTSTEDTGFWSGVRTCPPGQSFDFQGSLNTISRNHSFDYIYKVINIDSFDKNDFFLYYLSCMHGQSFFYLDYSLLLA